MPSVRRRTHGHLSAGCDKIPLYFSDIFGLSATSIAASLPQAVEGLTAVTQEVEALDRALVIRFPAPHSYTGEDMAELQVTGGRAVLARRARRSLSLPPRANSASISSPPTPRRSTTS